MNDGPKHPTWDGKETLDDTDLNKRAASAMIAFYLGRGFCEAPYWDEIGDDERCGWRSVIRAFDRNEISREPKEPCPHTDKWDFSHALVCKSCGMKFEKTMTETALKSHE